HTPAAKHCFRQLRKGLTSVPRVSMTDKLKSDGAAREPAQGGASPASLPHYALRERASTDAPVGASHAGVAVSGTCPTLCGGVWPHRPPLPAATALVVRGGIPHREEKPLRALGRQNGYGAGRVERKEDRRGVPTRLRCVSTSTT